MTEGMNDTDIRRALRARLGHVQDADLDDLVQDVHVQVLSSPTMAPMQAITRAAWYYRDAHRRYGHPIDPDDVAAMCDADAVAGFSA